MFRTSIVLLLFFLQQGSALAQVINHRLKIDFSLKETLENDKYHLFIGTIYYNITDNTLLYDLKFPKVQKWYVTDTATYFIRNDSIVDKKALPGFVEQSLFHLICKGDLNNFGLSNSILNITSVEKADSMVITTWEPETENEVFKGRILTSVVKNRLFGVAYLNEDGSTLSKQFYKEYKSIDDKIFPHKVIYVLNIGEKEYYRIMTFRNVLFDENDNEELYNYNLH